MTFLAADRWLTDDEMCEAVRFESVKSEAFGFEALRWLVASVQNQDPVAATHQRTSHQPALQHCALHVSAAHKFPPTVQQRTGPYPTRPHIQVVQANHGM
ncbi:hypothetical protein RA876_09900 [Rhodoferax antarcticus]|nr:hypothetical protein RA876_09900 [Rhodoferax antarcticus]